MYFCVQYYNNDFDFKISLNEFYTLKFVHVTVLQLYGVGSKESTVQKFCERQLDELNYIIVKGYQPSVDARTILQVTPLLSLL